MKRAAPAKVLLNISNLAIERYMFCQMEDILI
jgi:hypothetical protein